MNTLRYVIISTALLLAAALLPVERANAVTATVSATIVSPNDATAELLKRASAGLFTLGLPRGLDSYGAANDITLSSIWVRGDTIIISISGSTPKPSLVLAVATYADGMNGILSTGQGVNLIITHAEEDGTGRGKVYAIIAYN